MTSPDGLPLGSYNPQTPAIGDWDFDGLDLVALGDEVLFGPIRQLLSAVTGLPLSTWPTVPDIIDGAKNVLGAIGKGIEQLLSGVIPIGLLSPTVPNLLANGAFDGAQSMVEGEGWTWDAVEGRTSPGCALFTATGLAGVQLSTPVQVAEGQKLACEGWVKWSGVAASAGSGFRIERRWYDGTTLVSTDLVAETLNPPTSGGWTRLNDEVTTPVGVDTVCLALVVDAGVTAGQVWFDDAALTKPTTSLPQQWISGLVDELGALGDDVAEVLAWIKDLIEKLTGRAWPTITDAVAGVQTFAEQLKTILSGGVVSSPLPSLVGSTIREARTMIEQIAGIAAGDPVTPINGVIADFKDGWTGISNQISDAAANAATQAVEAVVDGMNGLGSFANAITSAINAAINETIGAIFGDGGTKWGQEVLVASGPVTTGPNDIPLGFGMPFSGKITDLAFYSSDHVSTGAGSQVAIEIRKNGAAIYSTAWSGGTNSKTVGSLNISVAKLDRITVWVTSVTSQMANMSVSVVGKYV
ncbi:MAG: hypothetical protein WBA98_03675 [Gordonia sp. (in: high G+C Gram-positive bacteria)]|uniref:hypothetical protein n=1 Tax=Gordonia sp. (in: high G+C Gram-positive bacteria) TaxID=84139 RepID=UPI003C7935DB